MHDFFTQYGLFLAKAVTVLAVILVIIARIAGVHLRIGPETHEHLKVRKLNRRLRGLQRSLEAAVLSEKDFKTLRK